MAEILPRLDDDSTLEVAEYDLHLSLTCYRVLEASGSPLAAPILSQTHRILQERAATISDEKLRRSSWRTWLAIGKLQVSLHRATKSAQP